MKAALWSKCSEDGQKNAERKPLFVILQTNTTTNMQSSSRKVTSYVPSVWAVCISTVLFPSGGPTCRKLTMTVIKSSNFYIKNVLLPTLEVDLILKGFLYEEENVIY